MSDPDVDATGTLAALTTVTAALEASEQRVQLMIAEGRLEAAARSNERFAQDAQRLGLQLYGARSALLSGKIARQ